MRATLWDIIKSIIFVDDIVTIAKTKGSTPHSEACNIVFDAIKTGNLNDIAHVSMLRETTPPIKWTDGNWYEAPPRPDVGIFNPLGEITDSKVIETLNSIRNRDIQSFEELTPDNLESLGCVPAQHNLSWSPVNRGDMNVEDYREHLEKQTNEELTNDVHSAINDELNSTNSFHNWLQESGKDVELMVANNGNNKQQSAQTSSRLNHFNAKTLTTISIGERIVSYLSGIGYLI